MLNWEECKLSDKYQAVIGPRRYIIRGTRPDKKMLILVEGGRATSLKVGSFLACKQYAVDDNKIAEMVAEDRA